MTSSIQLYENKLKDEKDGKMPLFRPKGFMSEERRMAKLRKLKQWHKVGAEEELELLSSSAHQLVLQEPRNESSVSKTETGAQN